MSEIQTQPDMVSTPNGDAAHVQVEEVREDATTAPIVNGNDANEVQDAIAPNETSQPVETHEQQVKKTLDLEKPFSWL